MKKIYYLFTFVIVNILFITVVNAFNITGDTSVYKGSSVTLSINCNGMVGRLDVSSTNPAVLQVPSGASYWCESQTIAVVATARDVGTATINVLATYTDSNYVDHTDNRSITINVVNRSSSGNNNSSNNGGSGRNNSIDINKTYSSNNYLKFLDVDGYDITPKFDKDTLEYKLNLDSNITSINIKATPADENANVKGAGEVAVSDGINTINIVVTAENGNERTYKIIATVEDKNPIKVKIGNKKYTVVKKRESLGTKEGYTEKEVEIKGTKVPALYNEVTKVTLVGLKDSKGNIRLYSYDTKTGEFNVYNEFKFDIMNLYVHEASKSKYKKTKIKINDTEVTAYKINGVDDYYLLYATNMSTGYKGYYLYDSKENSVQRYNEEMLSKIMQEKDKYFIIVIVLSCVCFLCMAFMLIQLNKGKK